MIGLQLYAAEDRRSFVRCYMICSCWGFQTDSEKEMTNEYSTNEKPTHEVSHLYHGVCLFKTYLNYLSELLSENFKLIFSRATVSFFLQYLKTAKNYEMLRIEIECY